jgi:autotransporter-associated beta strand protein
MSHVDNGPIRGARPLLARVVQARRPHPRVALLATAAVALAFAAQADAQTYTFGYTGAAQTFDITTSGTYVFTVAGASGGNGTSGNANLLGGNGAVIIGSYALLSGDRLNLIVGGAGVSATGFNGGGGGGGSFVVDITASPQLIVAAGGGGGGGAQSGGASGGQITTSGAYGAGSGAGPGGDNGTGGTAKPNIHVGGGGGFLTAGQNSSYATGGAAYPSLAGGTNPYGAAGGFGGGGAASQEGGGGGGYSGGGGGSGFLHYGGGGGGSYQAADFTLTSATAGSNGGAAVQAGNLGHGYIIFYLQAPLLVVPSASAIGGGTFLASALGDSVLPQFQGGTLRMDVNGRTYGQAFTLAQGANTIDLSGHTVTFSGPFSNAGASGALVIANSEPGGRATFTGTNTYTGTTTIEAGAALALAGDGAISQSSSVIDNGVFDISGVSGPQAAITSLAGAGRVDLGAVTLNITRGADTFSGGFSGTGGLIVSGGVQTLSGPSAITTTTVAGGALVVTGALSSAFTIGSGGRLQGDADSLLAQGGLVDDGMLVFDQTTDGVFANAVAGSGVLIKQGAGALTLRGASSVGATTVAGGSLILAAPLTSAFNIDNGATLQADGASLLARGQVRNNGTLVFDQSGVGAFSGAVAGPGMLVKQNTGLLALNGASSAGQTTVNAGNLQIGDLDHPSARLTSAVTVNPGAILSGHGRIVGAVTNAGGAVSPGGSIGTLIVEGGYAQSAGGTLMIELDPQISSQLVVTGTAALNGKLELLATPGTYRAGTRYAVVSAGALSGRFADATLSNGLPFTVASEGAAEVVTLSAGLFPTMGATQNQAAAGASLVNVPIGRADFDTVATALTALPTDALQQAAAEATGGEVAAIAALEGRTALRGFMGVVSDQLFDERQQSQEGRAAWGRVFGGSGAVRGGGGAHRVSTDRSGLVAGGSAGLGQDSTLGAFFGYHHADFSLRGLPQSGTEQAYVLGVYGERRMGAWFVDAAATAGAAAGDSRRTIAFGPIVRKAEGRSTGTLLSGLLKAGVRWRTPAGILIEPSVSALVTRVAQGGYTESGAGDINLVVADKVDRAAQGELGVRFVKSFPLSQGRSLDLEGHAAGVQDFSAEAPTIREAYSAAPANSFTLVGAAPGANGAVLGAGVTYVAQQLSFYGRYEAAWTGASHSRRFTAGLRLAW